MLMAKKQGNTVASVREQIEKIVLGFDLSLWDICFEKEGAVWYLRVFIDKEDGVTIEDCEKVSRALDPVLDERDVIQHSYCLEVSSPGLERKLIREEHFEQFLGADIMVKMIRPIENIGRELDGTLVSCDKDSFVIADANGQELKIDKKDTVWVKLDDFDI